MDYAIEILFDLLKREKFPLFLLTVKLSHWTVPLRMLNFCQSNIIGRSGGLKGLLVIPTGQETSNVTVLQPKQDDRPFIFLLKCCLGIHEIEICALNIHEPRRTEL